MKNYTFLVSFILFAITPMVFAEDKEYDEHIYNLLSNEHAVFLKAQKDLISVDDTRLYTIYGDLLGIHLSDNDEDFARAHMAIVSMGVRILPKLIADMISEVYLLDEQSLGKIRDPAWHKRMKLAWLIQDISGVDFHVSTSAQGWNPNVSFELINKWWNERNP